MVQARLRAAFYRGGTSKAVLFNGADLPKDRATRDRIFLHVLGSPDPYGRQLNGMGGGLSSLSKVVIVEPSSIPGADVDYTFVQIAVDQPIADYGSACGNMSSAVGPFAVDEGLVRVADGMALVRIHSTNTGQIYHARFPVSGGKAQEEGDFSIAGVSGTGAKVTLDFLSPGGSKTGSLMPTGAAREWLETPDGRFEASLIDAANPVVYLRAVDVGCTGTELPQELDADSVLMQRLDRLRRAGGVAMGLAETTDEVPLSNPKVAIVGAAADFTALDGSAYAAASHDVSVRLVSMGNFHRAITLTGAMCVAVAAQLKDSLVEEVAGGRRAVRIATPSGILPAAADVSEAGEARSATTYRTQRRIMEGALLYPGDLADP